MTYDPKASQLTSTPLTVHTLNCRRQGLMETPIGLINAHLKPELKPSLTSATGCKETHLTVAR